MSNLKTRPTDQEASQFIDAVEPDQKRKDCWTIVEMMREITGSEPVMWGSSIIGFGAYTYVNSSKKPADWPITGFSPRKTNLALYVMPGFSNYQSLMARLGEYSTGKSCLYVKKLADIDLDVLKEVIARSVRDMEAAYPTR